MDSVIRKPEYSLRGSGLIALLAVYLALVIGFAWNPTPFAQVLAAIGIMLALVHAALTYGTRHALALFAICVGITFLIENIGISTGLPFGHYHFEVDADLPHVGLVPLVVGPLWFGMGYFSWIVAGAILNGGRRGPIRRYDLFAVPAVAVFVMTQWDLVMEAPYSTIANAWIWHDGGAYFGVPFLNFVGWLVTSWLFYAAFAIYLFRQQDLRSRVQSRTQSRILCATAVLIYAASGLTHVTAWLMHEHGEVADAAGQIWRVDDLRETTVIVMLFTMMFTAVVAMLRLFRPE
jgi:uncharacterized membrane protein